MVANRPICVDMRLGISTGAELGARQCVESAHVRGEELAQERGLGLARALPLLADAADNVHEHVRVHPGPRGKKYHVP